ncbi:hypothetical protein niasHT_025864 [Heterodera trifolii]|uniref:Transposase n=1 Tax=Heterodera trifolii TaxID=157864 RepID=A0ABD2KJC3_9BILA
MKRLSRKIWICNDVWMDILPFFDYAQLGLDLALLSPRFDVLVDKHFNVTTELTIWRPIIIHYIESKLKVSVRHGHKFVHFPLPDRPLPNKIRFKSLYIHSIDHSVITFLRANKQIFDERGTKLELDVRPNEKLWDDFVREIWPIFATNVRHLSFSNCHDLDHLWLHSSPSFLSNLDISIASDNLLPSAVAYDGPYATISQALSKWLHTPKKDGQPKQLSCSEYGHTSKIKKMITSFKEEFLDATTSSANYIIQLQLRVTFQQSPSTQISSAEEAISDLAVSISSDEFGVTSPKRKKYSHKKPGGGLSNYDAKYAEKFKADSIQKSNKGIDKFFCKACDQNYKIQKMGEKAITDHIRTTKHKKNLAEFNRNVPLTDFVKQKSASEEKRCLAAELTLAYHCARHNFSMSSANCSSDLFGVVFSADPAAIEFASKRDKTTALIRGVLSPHFLNNLLDEIKETGRFSIGIDSTSMDNIRYYAIVIRYWHGETKTGILEVCSETSEKAVDMEALLTSLLDRCGLPLARFVSLCADNTTANFGGRERRGRNNLFHFLTQKKTNLVGIGCSSHICNNEIGYAVEKCDYDVRNFSRTIADHFSNHPGRWELFQEMAAEENVIVHIFPAYTAIRWMSLGRTFKRIREMWTVLEKYFRSLRDRDCPKFLRQIFDDELTPRSEEWKVVVCFMCFAFDQFNQLNLISQKPTLPFPILAKQIKTLKTKLELSLNEEFYGEETSELLKQLENDGAIYQKNKLKAAFKQFYEDAYEYLGNWSRQFSETDEVIGDWVIFESEPSSEKVRKAYRHFCGTIADEMDALFGEIAELKQTLKELQGDRFNKKNGFELMNERTNEMLTLKKEKKMTMFYFMLKRCQIGKTIQWEDKKTDNVNNVDFTLN